MVQESAEALIGAKETLAFIITFAATVFFLWRQEKSNPNKYAVYRPWLKKERNKKKKKSRRIS